MKEVVDQVLEKAKVQFHEIDWDNSSQIEGISRELRPKMLEPRYISDKPFYKVILLNDLIEKEPMSQDIRSLLKFALSAILAPVSNVKYGPGFGVGKAKDDADVLAAFSNKLVKILNDLNNVSPEQINMPSHNFLGDSRQLSSYVKADSISLIVTSPPYPGDHEYTKHSRLELIFQGMATDITSFRKIKKRMLRASTTNIYREDNEREYVCDLNSIIDVTTKIDERLTMDGASSGFEKLYTKLVWEYFGGMEKTLQECFKVLKPGGKIALLVSDSHAFKMVHIQTAQILGEIGVKAGFHNMGIVLWQTKNSTSHKHQLRENILILQKPIE